MILTPNRLELNGNNLAIEAIDDLIYHRIAKSNRSDEYYTKVRDAIAKDKEKLRAITLAKCFLYDGVLYYNNRLWVPESMFTELIREVYNQPAYRHPGVARTYELLKREYYWRGIRTIVATYIRNYYAY